MFESTGVMTRKELESRNEVKWEMYTKKIQIEARVLGDLVMNHIVPVAIEYQTKLVDNAYKMKSLFSAEEATALSAENLAIIKEIAEHTAFIKEQVDEMVEARKIAIRQQANVKRQLLITTQSLQCWKTSAITSTNWN